MQRAARGMLLSSRLLLLPGCGYACNKLPIRQLSDSNRFSSQASHYRCLVPQVASAHSSSIASAAVAAITATGSSGQGARLPDLQQSMAGSDSIPALTLQQTLEVVKVPPNPTNPGARVEHLEVTADGMLSDVVATALQLPVWFVLELMRFGAVHYCPIMPSPAAAARPRMSQQHLQHVEQLRAAGLARHGRNPALQHPKRILQDQAVAAGGYVRVHVHPKRFPAAHSCDWKAAILADMQEYVVVDKPPGVQVPPTVDNLLESVVCCTATALGLPPDALLNTHRLDAGTSGVVVLAKTRGFAAWFNLLLKHKPHNVVKIYRCLTDTPPPLGSMVHYATMRVRAGGEPAHTRMRRPAAAAAAAAEGSAAWEQEEGARCELVVLQVEQVQLTGKAAADWGPTAYETTLQLITGRTHQIRAQMAAEGCPLLGDQLYQALAGMWAKERQQQQQLQLGAQAGEPDQAASSGWGRIYQEDPLRPIGLQAHVLRVRDVDGRMSGRGVQQQQQQMDELPAGPGGQPEQPHQEQHAGQEDTARDAIKAPQQTDYIGDVEQQQPLPSSLASVGSGTATAGTSSEEWVEFRTGTPWWRSQVSLYGTF